MDLKTLVAASSGCDFFSSYFMGTLRRIDWFSSLLNSNVISSPANREGRKPTVHFKYTVNRMSSLKTDLMS